MFTEVLLKTTCILGLIRLTGASLDTMHSNVRGRSQSVRYEHRTGKSKDDGEDDSAGSSGLPR